MDGQTNITEFTDGKKKEYEPETARLKNLARINPTKSELSDLDPETKVSFVPLEDFGTDGEIKDTETRPLEEVHDGYTYFREGDIAIAKITPSFENGKGAICRGLKNGIGFGTTELHILRPREGVSTDFLWYVLRSKPFINEAETAMRGVAGQQRVPTEMLANYRAPTYSLEIERKIASKVQKESKTVDQLLENLETLAQKLAEYKRSFYVQTLTGGEVSDPSASEPFATVIPDTWESVKLKWIAEVIDTKHRTAKYVEDGVPIISPSEVSGKKLEIKNANQTTEEEYEDLIEGGRRPTPGDIIYSRNASVGNAALVNTDEKMCMGQDLCLIRSDVSDFLYHVLNSRIITSQVSVQTVGATFDRINVNDIKEFKIPLPPKEDRIKITREFDRMNESISNVMQNVDSLEKLLMERRRTFITNAVAGQINLNHDTTLDR